MSATDDELEKMAKKLRWDLFYPMTHKQTEVTILTALKQVRNAARAEAVEECAKIAEAHIHTRLPVEGGDDLDKIARYSNSTCKIISTSIRSLLSSEKEGRG